MPQAVAGVPPANWASANLRWLADIYAGGTPDKANLDYWTDGTVPWLNSGAVNDWAIHQPSTLITTEAVQQSSARWVPARSVLVALAGQGKTKGMSARLEIASTCNQSMAAIVPGPRLDYRYLHFWLTANYQTLRHMTGGDARDGLNLQHIGSLPTPLPPVEVQRRIASFLDDQCGKIDAVVQMRNQQVGALALLYQQFSMQVTTTGSAAQSKPSGVTWMPEIAANWSIPKIAWLFRTGSGTTPPSDKPVYYDGEVPWVNTGDVRNTRLSATSKQVSRTALAEFSTLRVYGVDALVVAMYGQGSTKGRVALLDVPACVNQACCVLTSVEPGLTEWAFHWFQAHKDQIVQLAVGSGQPNLNQEIIRSLRIPLPEPQEMTSLVARLREKRRTTDSAVWEMNAEIEALTLRKESLIAAAVTGEFDVATASGRGI